MRRNLAALIALVVLGEAYSHLFPVSPVEADSICDDVAECEQKAENYQKIINLKKQQQNTLNNQISLIEAENSKLEAELKIKKDELGDVSSQVARLETQITEYARTLESQRLILGDLVRSYYESRTTSSGIEFLAADDFYGMLQKEDGLLQTEGKLKEGIDNINTLRKKLEEQKQELADKQIEIQTITDQLETKNAALENNQAQKKNLLTATRGEELKYQQLLAKVEKQKEELLNIDELSTAGGLSADDYAKPTSGLASTSWFYSQRDPRWGNDEIGRSRSLMKDWGCAVTAVAMVFKYHDSSVTPKKLADSSSLFSWDLIKWPATWTGGIELVSSISHGNIRWSTIDSEIKNGNPVIVYIKKTNGRGGHYVVIHHKTSGGKYVVHDPYFGANIFLDTSRSLVGKMGADSSTVIDQMIIYHK